MAVVVQSTSQQKKKQCSSPLSTCDDKTSACSTPALSPIKNESLTKNRYETSTPLFLAMPAISRNSPSTNSSVQSSSQKQNKQTSSNDTSLLSFEQHELSAGNATLMTTNDQDENYSPTQIHRPVTTNADWSYFVTVSEGLSKELERPSPTTSSSSSSSNQSNSRRRHAGGLEFFINGEQQDTPARKSQHPILFNRLFFCSISTNSSITISSIRFTNTSSGFSCNKSKTYR